MIAHGLRLIQRLLREPLVHFLVLGAGLFLTYSLVNEGVDEAPDRIVVDEVRALRLAEQFQRTWMRPPTRQELEALVEDFVKEEILYREALALGLDQDDLIIRRRMRQKMEFLNADLAEQRVPTDAELQAYLDAHPDRFRRPPQLSFQQIYFNPERHGDDLEGQAGELLARLNGNPAEAGDPRMLGDPTLLPPRLDAATPREIAGTFGSGFAADMETAPVGRWSGPLQSSYGLHLVRVTKHEPESLPALAEVRASVEREWSAENRRQANESFYQALRQRYTVEVRLPDTAGGEPLAARQP